MEKLVQKILSGNENLKDAYDIRESVFIKEQGINNNVERDRFDRLAVHAVIYENNAPVATGRLVVKGDNHYIQRVAVLKEHRKKKLGKKVVDLLIQEAGSNGANEVYLAAQKYVQKFYEELDFSVYGNTYIKEGIEHVDMKKRI